MGIGRFGLKGNSGGKGEKGAAGPPGPDPYEPVGGPDELNLKGFKGGKGDKGDTVSLCSVFTVYVLSFLHLPSIYRGSMVCQGIEVIKVPWVLASLASKEPQGAKERKVPLALRYLIILAV